MTTSTARDYPWTGAIRYEGRTRSGIGFGGHTDMCPDLAAFVKRHFDDGCTQLSVFPLSYNRVRPTVLGWIGTVDGVRTWGVDA